MQHNEYIFCISFILFFHPSPVYVIDYAKCPSPETENSERNSLFSVREGRKIAFSRPWFLSLGTENSIEYAKCPSPGTENSGHNSLFSVRKGRKIAFYRPWFPSPGTENSERNSLFSVLHGRKIAFSRAWFLSVGTENNINVGSALVSTSYTWKHVANYLGPEFGRLPIPLFLSYVTVVAQLMPAVT